MDFTFVVQDFLLEAVHRDDFFNSERLGQATKWMASSKESEFIINREAGNPCFELGGLYFLGT
ncbi:hypothetical protein AU14_17665 [Marinobacter similis]|uniref:Uncharacterized protein n=1 Tax=Marinobacter similis TaxID=1420916 RepID=W5YMM9_9GAMM|nr:hypothetical protein AU14_17665 [Marinobacter similis]